MNRTQRIWQLNTFKLQTPQRFIALNVCVSCESYKRRVLVEASFCELFEAFGEITSQCWRRGFGDVEEHSHWMHVGVRRFPLGELDGRDAQRPNIRLGGANNKHIYMLLTVIKALNRLFACL